MFLTPYSKTLFVDPSGNDSTAILGNLSKPWSTVNGAINSATMSGYTIHIFRGDYSENTGVTMSSGNTNLSLLFETGANLRVTLSAGYWFNVNASTSIVNITGTGRSSNLISSNNGVFNVFGPNGGSSEGMSLNINNIQITSSNSSAGANAIKVTEGTVKIDNSIVNFSGVNITNYQQLIIVNKSYLFVRNSTLEFSNNVQFYLTPPPSAGALTASWLIFEPGGIQSSVCRIRLQNTSLSCDGAFGGHICLTNGAISGLPASILLENVYFHSNSGKVTHTIYNNAGKEFVALGGSVISGGFDPTLAPSAGTVNATSVYPPSYSGAVWYVNNGTIFATRRPY